MKDYQGENYMRANHYQWMNDDQFECYKMLCDIFGGSHHVYDKVYSAAENGIYIDCDVAFLGGGFATYDFNGLTYAVLLAHDRAIRFDISPKSNRKLRLYFHKRGRDGKISQRHPTIDEAIKSFTDAKNR